MQDLHFELVSFDICPYVQRSVIMLKQKKIPFKLTLIDLESPPEWFNSISPLGKVPLLLIRKTPAEQAVVLFESAAINEYLDAVTPPAVHATDFLERAKENAWIAVSGDLMMALYTVMSSADQTESESSLREIWEVLPHLEREVQGVKTFSKRGFSLVDAAFAPFFMRLFMMKSLKTDPRWEHHPKIFAWANSLLSNQEVLSSVNSDFKDRYRHYLKRNESLLANDIV